MKNFVAKYIMKNFETDECNTVFHITFQYKTKKGNIKQQTVAIKQANEKEAKGMFGAWLDIMHNDNPKYVMKDPEIISIEEVV